MGETLLWAPRAWLQDRWRETVLIGVGGDGRFSAFTPEVGQPPPAATVLPGPALPALVDAHSHAFQRAFVGLSERAERAGDDFWSWRDRMYQVAERVTPAGMQAIAAQLFVELLRGGYTQVCEFHYLQQDQGGRDYGDPLQLGWSLADAAAEAGIGMTLLPALYQRSGFGQIELRDDQRRFSSTPHSIWSAARRIAAARRPLLTAGIAVHSLRAAAPDSMRALLRLAHEHAGPVHIHVSEQRAEVTDCLAATGARPVEWLLRERMLDRRWQLVHATHCVRAEIEGVAHSGAGVVLCPSTEGNLGDGRVELREWLEAGVPLAIGTDSHVTRCWREELRWLDYSQRLAHGLRGASTAPTAGWPSAAERLFAGAVRAGGAAAGEARWGLVPGARADLLVMDPEDDSLRGIPPARLLDATVFSSPALPWRDVMVAGRWVVRNHQHAGAAAIARRFETAMHELWV
ncbi:MAG TPA: formimidoylglutamate deiminase [Steroidobacteraceae bacterium]|nr:formimidoylglutamate deiminase [Steroidobacteraceae bacterium]